MATKEENTIISSKPPLPLQENGGETLPREDPTKDAEGGALQVKTKLQKEKKIGHRRVDASTGLTTYKKTPSSALSGSIQRGISHTVAGLSSKPERDVLMQDFQVVETISFPSEGSNITPAHHFGDFTFRTYAPTAFRYFRDLFGIRPDDYMLSISQPLIELSNPGASGSLFFVTQDDEFIIKTVQHKEAEFLQKLLPGYYMNLVQNPKTLLPKFYGLYCVQSAGKNIRIVVMNNLLPRKVLMHLKYDLKGSTYKRKASKYERAKKNPVYKDLDLINDLGDGLLLDPEIYSVLVKTMQRDCLVLQSFKIMDYSLLLAIHNLDQAEAAKAKESESQESKSAGQLTTRRGRADSSDSDDFAVSATSSGVGQGQKMSHATRNAVVSSTMLREKYSYDLDLWAGGIPAKNKKGENLLLFCGIIDILQCYKLKKKLEHTFKSMIADGDTVSVHKPAFYCKRFQTFMTEHVFKNSSPGKGQMSQRLKSHSTRRIQNISSNPDTKAGSSATLPATASSSVVSRLQGRPDLLPSESPRPSSVTKEDDDVSKQSESYGNQPVASASSPAQLVSKGKTSRKETTREVKSETLKAKQPSREGSIAGASLEVGEGGEAAVADVLRSSQVDLSIEENVEQKPASERPHAENDKAEVKISGQSSVVYHDTAF